MKLKDLPIFDLTAGLVTNKADVVMENGELKDSLNLDLDEQGRLKRRKGIQQWGDTKAGIIDDSFLFTLQTAGSSPTTYHLIVDRDGVTSVLYKIISTYTAPVIVAGATTIVTKGVSSGAGDFTSGVTQNAEVNGDLFAYTGITTNTLTGVTGTLAHPAYSLIHQILTVDATIDVDTRSGVYFAVLNNLLFINGRVGSSVFNGSAMTNVSDVNEPAGLFATNYRERIYVAGSGGADASGVRNGSSTRVSYSEPGDPTDWGTYTVNFFDVEDDSGESITGLRELNDTLLVFKLNSIFSYDEVQLKQRQWNVGAYNHKSIKRIGEVLYTFCPTGVYVTNGVESQLISKPVEKYLRAFKPLYDSTFSRVVESCFAGTFNNKYYLYIGDVNVDGKDLTDIVLIYDTIKGNWTVQDGYTNITHFGSFKAFDTKVGAQKQIKECLFAGDTGGKYYRLFENKFLDNEATKTVRGGDILPNMISDSVGSAIQTTAETKWYNIGDEPTQWSKFSKLSVLVETGSYQVAYKLDKGDFKTDWIPLGDFKNIQTIKPRDNVGYRIKFKITSNERDILNIFNGFILKGRETLDQEQYGINK